MVTTTSNFDQKRDKAYPVRRKVVPITIAAEGTIGSTTLDLNGRVIKMIYDVPALVGAATTVTFAILDEDTTSHYSKATIPEGAVTVDSTMVAAATPHGVVVAGAMTIKATASAAQTGAAAAINVIIFLV
jgi:hypothetical protein